jgi:hypothetical protein
MNDLAIKENNPVLILETEKVYGDLTVSDIKSAKINENHKDILIAKYSEKQIKNIDANYAGERLKTLINLTIFESGFKVENISEIIIMVIRDIFSDFSFMTLSEVSIAFRKGVRGQLGEFMGLSVRTFYFWLKEYNEYKLEALKQIQYIKKEEPVTQEKLKEHKINWLKSFINDFEQYKKTGISDNYDFKNLFYAYCVKNNIGYLTLDEKLEIENKAKRELIKSHNPLNAFTNDQRKEFKNILQGLVSDEKDKSIDELIIMQSKRMAITVIYDKLISGGLELRDIISHIEQDAISFSS